MRPTTSTAPWRAATRLAAVVALAGSAGFAAEAPALQALLDEAVRTHAPCLELPEGRIQVAGSLRLQGANGLVIAGPRTTLVFSDPSAMGLRISGCRDLVLRGFTVDYDPLPFVQGSITARAADGTWLDVEVHAGYPGFAAESLAAYRQAYVFEAGRERWKRWLPDLYPRRVEIRDPRHGRLIFGQAPACHERLAVGDRIVLTLRTSGVCRLDDVENIRVEDVTILAGPGVAILCRYMRGDNAFRYTVEPGPMPPGATQPRLISTCADAFNYAFATRGPTLDGCRFSFMGDDSVNLHGATFVVVRQESPTAILAAWPYGPESLATVMPAGAAVRRLRPGNFEILGEAPLAGFAAEKEKQEADLGWIRKTWPRNPPERGTVWRLTLAAPLPVQPGDLLDVPASNAPGFAIRNCTFTDHRARGLRIMAPHGVIENNTFQRLRHAAVSLGSEYGYWREAGWVEDITVRGNRIEDVCQDSAVFSPRSYTPGAIAIFARQDEGSRDAYWPGNRAIRIEDNTVHGSTVAGIYAAAVRELTVRGNRVERTLYHPGEAAATAAGLDLREAIDLRHATAATATANTVTDSGRAPAGTDQE